MRRGLAAALYLIGIFAASRALLAAWRHVEGGDVE